MKTWQAALLHTLTGAAQSAAAVQFFSPADSNAMLANTGIQIGLQFGLVALQTWIANKNSNTDPKGNPLFQVNAQKYVSIEPAAPVK